MSEFLQAPTLDELLMQPASLAIDLEAISKAKKFEKQLPSDIPYTDVTAYISPILDAYESKQVEVDFEWFQNPNWVVSITLEGDQIYYAALFGDQSPRGNLKLGDYLPQELKELLDVYRSYNQ